MAQNPQPWMLARLAIGGGGGGRRRISPDVTMRPGLVGFGDSAGTIAGPDGAGDHGGVDRASRDRLVGSGNFEPLGSRARGSSFSEKIRALGGSRTRRCEVGGGIHRRKRLCCRSVGAVSGGVHSLGCCDCLGNADVVGAVPHRLKLALEEFDGGAVVGEEHGIVLLALTQG